LEKVAFITGTGKGIGKAIAETLLHEKYIVFGFSRTNSIEHKNFNFIKTNISNLEEVQNLTFPKLKSNDLLLVNNAATIGEIVPIDIKSDFAIIEEYNLNIIAPALLCKKFIRSFQKANKLIINISSGAAIKSVPCWSTYCSAKSALDRFSEVIDAEKHKNLAIFSVHPGIVDTNMQTEIRDADPNLFPLLSKFTHYYKNNELETAVIIAQKIMYIIKNTTKFKQNVLSLRDVSLN
tara:strand:+ start:32954 stop:33661 length:708 start_codon:yes stop_codon:yes gene_type:complete